LPLITEPELWLSPQPRHREEPGLEIASRYIENCVLLIMAKLNQREV
jgi:hypothetical protein